MLHDSTPSHATRPGLLTAGFITVVTAVASAIASAVLWLVMYQYLVDLAQPDLADRETAEALAVFNGMVYVVVGLSILLVLGLAAGGILMMYGRNAGRVLVWTFGGISIAWRMCCGLYSSTILFSIYEVGREHTIPAEVPVAELTTATILDLASGVITIVAIVLIAQSSVNIYFRRLKADRQGSTAMPYSSMPGLYEPFGQPPPMNHGPQSAPSAPWPHGPTESHGPHGPTAPPSAPPTWGDPVDDSMWRPPGSSPDDGSSGGNHPLNPPR